MAIDNSIRTYTANPLMPLYPGSKMLPVNLAANTKFPKGVILGQVSTPVNDVQTLTVTGAPTGGLVRIRAYNPYSGGSATFDLVWNSTAAAAQTAIRAQLGISVSVTGGPLPGTPLVFTFHTYFAFMPVTLMVVDTSLLTGGTPATTIVKTTNGASKGTFGAYASGNADGTQVARCILQYQCATDSSGRITFGPLAIEGYNGEVFPDAPAFVGGFFDTKELVGLDQAAVDAMGFLKSGTIADGVLCLPM